MSQYLNHALKYAEDLGRLWRLMWEHTDNSESCGRDTILFWLDKIKNKVKKMFSWEYATSGASFWAWELGNITLPSKPQLYLLQNWGNNVSFWGLLGGWKQVLWWSLTGGHWAQKDAQYDDASDDIIKILPLPWVPVMRHFIKWYNWDKQRKQQSITGHQGQQCALLYAPCSAWFLPHPASWESLGILHREKGGLYQWGGLFIQLAGKRSIQDSDSGLLGMKLMIFSGRVQCLSLLDSGRA